MSKTHERPPLFLVHSLKAVFRRAVEKSGGKAIITISDDEIVSFEASLCEGRYHLYLDLEWNGQRYEVTRFLSIEAVHTLGSDKYLQAEQVLVNEVGTGRWQVMSPKSIIALFNAHTWWSNFFGIDPVFTQFS